MRKKYVIYEKMGGHLEVPKEWYYNQRVERFDDWGYNSLAEAEQAVRDHGETYTKYVIIAEYEVQEKT